MKLDLRAEGGSLRVEFGETASFSVSPSRLNRMDYGCRVQLLIHEANSSINTPLKFDPFAMNRQFKGCHCIML